MLNVKKQIVMIS